MNPFRTSLISVAAAAIVVSAAAQQAAIINKSTRFVQTGPATTTADSSSPFFFEANIEGTATSPAGPISITLPGSGGTRTLRFDAQDGAWRTEQGYTTQAALDAAYPNGNYTFTFGGRNIPVSLTGDVYPAAPVATVSGGTWINGVLTVDRAQTLTITTSFTRNYVAGASRLGIDIGGGSLHLSADTSPAFDRNQVSLNVPANTLVAGVVYEVEIVANRFVSLDMASAAPLYVVGLYSAVTSFQLTVAGPPTIIGQPVGQQIASGSTVVFSVSSPNATSYQWRKDGVNLANATRATLAIFGATNSDAGAYSVVASNTNGNVTSQTANLGIVNTTNTGRLINLSILTPLAAGEMMTMGTAIGGSGTSGAKPLLARAAGPALAQLGVGGFLPDPTMTLVSTGSGSAVTVATNNDWAGAAELSTAFAQVGAFGYASANSKDAAIYRTNLNSGTYTVQVNDAGSGSGTVIAELYDATPTASFASTTPRLVNVSVLKQINTGASLTVGFYVGGSTSRTVLIRAIGPGLAQLGVGGTMADPQLTLFNSNQNSFAANDDWGGDAQIASAGSRVGAFGISNGASKDAMLFLTLAPGSYTARVNPVGSGGIAIVEVYEVP